jgi:hypothetical protein
MNYTDYVVSNDYTDMKEYELIIRIFEDNHSFGWYRYIETKRQVSDSQFDIGTIDPDNAEDIIKEKFGAYYCSVIH